MIRKRLSDEADGGAGRAGQRDIVAAVRQVIGYPPDLAEGATQLVLRQAESLTEYS